MSSGGPIGFKGLRTSGNQLTKPPGSLLLAENCVMVPQDIVSQRRGQGIRPSSIFGASTDKAYQLAQWPNTGSSTLLLHYGPKTDALHGAQVAISTEIFANAFRDLGAFLARDPENLRMRFVEMAQSMYFNTSVGSYGLTGPAAAVRAAGVPRPHDCSRLNGSAVFSSGLSPASLPGTGWMPVNSAVGYRCVVGRKDANGIVKLSAPCGRFVVVNPEDEAASLTRTGGTTVTATVVSHNFQVGDSLYLSSAGSADFLAGTGNPYGVTAITATTVTWTNVGTGANVTLAGQTISSGTKYIQLQVRIGIGELDVIAGDFVQVYRTLLTVAVTVDPGDEEFLAYEHTITPAEVVASYAVISDTTPELFLGPALYTNSNTGTPGGPDFEHLQPPLMNDMAVFDGRLWGTKAVGPQLLQMRLLGVGSPAGLQTGDLVAVGTYVYVANTAMGSNLWTVTSALLPSQNILQSVGSFLAVHLGFGLNGTDKLRARASANGTAPTGGITIEAISLTAGTFYAGVSRQSAWQDALALVSAVTAASTSRTTNVVTVTTATAHGLASGANVVLAIRFASAADANFPVGLKTNITVTGANTFTYAEAGSNAVMSGTYYAYAATYSSTAPAKQLRFSEPGMPEAWPLVNFPSGLPDGAVVSRIASLNAQLYIFLSHGDIYTLSGPYPYSVVKFDGTAMLVAPDTLQEHSGRLTCLTTQGVVAIGPRGVEVLSYEVDEVLRRFASKMSSNGVTGIPFAVSYESDRQYQLWLPDEDATDDATHWKCTQAYVYHSDSRQWTRWDVNTDAAALGATDGGRNCGVVLKTADLSFYGGQPQYLYQESKTFTWLDSADQLLAISCTGFAAGVATGAASAFAALGAGDVVKFPDGSYATITVTPGASTTLTTDGTYAGGAGSLAVWRAIAPLTVEWVADTSGAPGIEKHRRDWQLHVDQFIISNLNSSYGVFTTEKSQSIAGDTAESTRRVTIQPTSMQLSERAPYLQNFRGSIPDPTQRAAMHRFKVALGRQAFTRMRLLGSTLTGEPISEKTGR